MKNVTCDYLSIIESATDITKQCHITGTLFLTSQQGSFYFHWIPVNGKSTHQITTVFDPIPEIIQKDWDNQTIFRVLCTDISCIELKMDEQLCLILHHNKFEQSKIFQINQNEHISLVKCIEQLLRNGIFVPGTKFQYCFEVYKNSCIGTFSYIPSFIRLNAMRFKNIEELWEKVLQYYKSLLLELDIARLLPSDPEFPIATAARSSHHLFYKKLLSQIANNKQYDSISESEFHSFFDPQGQIIDQEMFRRRLYHSSIESITLLKEILPFAMGVYPLNSTSQERAKIDEQNDKNYESLYQQMINVQDEQIKNSQKKTDSYRVINHDVFRTDRHLNTFKNTKGIGSQLLINYLRMYTILDPTLGYLQGMNDIFVPFILAYAPNWTKDSSPILDENPSIEDIESGNVTIGELADLRSISPKIFWCFDSFIRKTNHYALLADVTNYCTKIAESVHEILLKLDPVAALWMKLSNITQLLWLYGDFVLFFKRTFQGDIWPLWFQFTSSPNPTKWMIYFTTAIIIASFEQLTLLPDVQLNAMMESFPAILKNLDRKQLGEIALWVSSKYPLPSLPSEDDFDSIKTEFSFFKPKSGETWKQENESEKQIYLDEFKHTLYTENYENC